MRAFCCPPRRKWACTTPAGGPSTSAALRTSAAVLPLPAAARPYATAPAASARPSRVAGRPYPARNGATMTRCRVRSVVGRAEVHHTYSPFVASVSAPCGGGRSAHSLAGEEPEGAAAREVQYDWYGTPVGGPLHSHAFADQLKIYTSLLLALLLTKCAFDALRFDMIYYDLWQVGLRWSTLWRERMRYYISTAVVGLSLLCGVGASFIAVATLLGRHQLGMHVLRRAVLPLARK